MLLPNLHNRPDYGASFNAVLWAQETLWPNGRFVFGMRSRARYRIHADARLVIARARMFPLDDELLSKSAMCRVSARAFFAGPLMLLPALAAAQPTPLPGSHERELAQIIRQAGQDCRAVESIEIAPSPDAGLESFRPEVALCTNGRKFLVVKGGRGGPNARPVVRPLPAETRL